MLGRTAPAARPLAGLTVLVTRAREQAGRLSEELRALGAVPYEFPVIEIAPPPDPAALDRTAAGVAGYGWVVLTSPNGVRCLLDRVLAQGLQPGGLAGVSWVAVGPATARALASYGLSASAVPSAYNAGALLALLRERVAPGEQVLVVRPVEAAADLAAALRGAGLAADEVVAYQTLPGANAAAAAALQRDLARGRIHYVTFTSGSTVRALLAILGSPQCLAGVRVACIGPQTAAVARDLGLVVDAVGRAATIESLVAALVADAARRRPASRPPDQLRPVSAKEVLPMGFPTVRPRRLRATETIRRLVRETCLTAADLIYPLFVVPGSGVKAEISAMPGQYHWSADTILYEVEESLAAGVQAFILFGIPEHKDATGSSALDPQGPVQRAVRAIKGRFPEAHVITDVCLCEYTDHGHCGVIRAGRVDNDPTLDILAQEALSHAEAGADMVAPSDMMDGRVAAIRRALDEHGFTELPIMAYSAKYASGYYGPFRVAAQSAPQFGDRRSYQMDPSNAREALREVELDLAEGADIVMVKPALAYLDIIWRVRELARVPVACYNVSGEYAMVKAAAAQGWINEERVVLETLTGMKRAGADLILTYHAKDVAGWLRRG